MKKMIGLMFALILIPSLCAYGGQPAVEQKAESGAAAETEAKEVTDAASENADADSGGVTQSQIEENIIGSWIVEERDGKPALTNEKSVFTFVSLTERG